MRKFTKIFSQVTVMTMILVSLFSVLLVTDIFKSKVANAASDLTNYIEDQAWVDTNFLEPQNYVPEWKSTKVYFTGEDINLTGSYINAGVLDGNIGMMMTDNGYTYSSSRVKYVFPTNSSGSAICTWNAKNYATSSATRLWEYNWPAIGKVVEHELDSHEQFAGGGGTSLSVVSGNCGYGKSGADYVTEMRTPRLWASDTAMNVGSPKYNTTYKGAFSFSLTDCRSEPTYYTPQDPDFLQIKYSLDGGTTWETYGTYSTYSGIGCSSSSYVNMSFDKNLGVLNNVKISYRFADTVSTSTGNKYVWGTTYEAATGVTIVPPGPSSPVIVAPVANDTVARDTYDFIWEASKSYTGLNKDVTYSVSIKKQSSPYTEILKEKTDLKEIYYTQGGKEYLKYTVDLYGLSAGTYQLYITPYDDYSTGTSAGFNFTIADRQIWDKFDSPLSYSEPTSWSARTNVTLPQTNVWTSYAWDGVTRKFYPAGTQVPSINMSSISDGTPYYRTDANGNLTRIKYYSGSAVSQTLDAITTTSSTTYIKGPNLLEENVLAWSGTYPANGRYATDGNWYVLKGTWTYPVAQIISPAASDSVPSYEYNFKWRIPADYFSGPLDYWTYKVELKNSSGTVVYTKDYSQMIEYNTNEGGVKYVNLKINLGGYALGTYTFSVTPFDNFHYGTASTVSFKIAQAMVWEKWDTKTVPNYVEPSRSSQIDGTVLVRSSESTGLDSLGWDAVSGRWYTYNDPNKNDGVWPKYDWYSEDTIFIHSGPSSDPGWYGRSWLRQPQTSNLSTVGVVGKGDNLLDPYVVALAGTYPDNGLYAGDGKWYVLKGNYTLPQVTILSPTSGAKVERWPYSFKWRITSGYLSGPTTGWTYKVELKNSTGSVVYTKDYSDMTEVHTIAAGIDTISQDIDLYKLDPGAMTLAITPFDGKNYGNPATIPFTSVTMYIWDKFTAISGNGMPTNENSLGTVSAPLTAYSSYSWSTSTKKFLTSGTKYTDYPNPSGTQPATAYSIDSSGNLILYKTMRNTNGDIISLVGKSIIYASDAATTQSGKVKGTLVQADIEAMENTYPVDGLHTDGYWYVLKGLWTPDAPLKFISAKAYTNNADTTKAKAGDTITYELTFNQEITVTGSSYVNGQVASSPVLISPCTGTGSSKVCNYKFTKLVDSTTTNGEALLTLGTVKGKGTGTVTGQVFTTDGSMVTVDTVVPTIDGVTVTSAEVLRGDVAEIYISASESLKSVPIVLIGSKQATVTKVSDTRYKAQVVIGSTELYGPLTIGISSIYDLAGNQGTNWTNTGKLTVKDGVVPVLSSVKVRTSTGSQNVTDGDKVYLDIASNTTINTPINATFNGLSPEAQTVNGNTITLTYTIRASDPLGSVVYNAYNVSTASGVLISSKINSSTDGSKAVVTRGSVPTSDVSVSISSSNSNPEFAKIGDTITVVVESKVKAKPPAVEDNNGNAFGLDSYDGTTFEYSRSVTASDENGIIIPSISNMIADNGTTIANMNGTTDGTIVTVDTEVPHLDSYVLNNGNLTLTFNEDIKDSFTLNVDGNYSNVIMNGDSTKTITISSSAEDISIQDVVDMAGNKLDSLTVHSTTQSSSSIMITITGLTNGASYSKFVIPVFTAASAESDDVTVTATLDGVPFTSGRPISTIGSHKLVVTAVDSVGNRDSLTINFTVKQ